MDTQKLNVRRRKSENQKAEPVRMSSLISVLTAAAMILLDKFGVANFSATEIAIILSAIIALANEAARMKVFAPYLKS
jgi:hypothetical protein